MQELLTSIFKYNIKSFHLSINLKIFNCFSYKKNKQNLFYLYYNLVPLSHQGKLFYFESSFSFNFNFSFIETEVFCILRNVLRLLTLITQPTAGKVCQSQHKKSTTHKNLRLRRSFSFKAFNYPECIDASLEVQFFLLFKHISNIQNKNYFNF